MYNLSNMTGSRVIEILRFINLKKAKIYIFSETVQKLSQYNMLFIYIVIFLYPKLSLALFSGSPSFAFAHWPTITILFANLAIVRIMLAVKIHRPEGCLWNPWTIWNMKATLLDDFKNKLIKHWASYYSIKL